MGHWLTDYGVKGGAKKKQCDVSHVRVGNPRVKHHNHHHRVS